MVNWAITSEPVLSSFNFQSVRLEILILKLCIYIENLKFRQVKSTVAVDI